MNLNEELKKLIELQKFDSEIHKVREEVDAIKPAQIKVLEDELVQKKQALKSAEDIFKKAQLTKKERELELAAKEEGVQKAQSQLYQLKSNKEYQAKMTEIASLKADISLFEEEVLKSIDQIEKVEGIYKAAKESFAQDEKSINEKISAIKKEAQVFADQVKGLEDQRSVVLKGVDPDILRQYERLLVKRAGSALSPVVGDEHCGYCHMKVLSQRINELKMRKALVFCDSCHRILYIPEDTDQ